MRPHIRDDRRLERIILGDELPKTTYIDLELVETEIRDDCLGIGLIAAQKRPASYVGARAAIIALVRPAVGCKRIAARPDASGVYASIRTCGNCLKTTCFITGLRLIAGTLPACRTATAFAKAVHTGRKAAIRVIPHAAWIANLHRIADTLRRSRGTLANTHGPFFPLDAGLVDRRAIENILPVPRTVTLLLPAACASGIAFDTDPIT